jgi:hypothetical protein
LHLGQHDALPGLAVERRVDRQPVIAHQRAVDEAVANALLGGTLNAGRLLQPVRENVTSVLSRGGA